jgi:hypothetical protein
MSAFLSEKFVQVGRTATVLLCVGSLSACVVAPYRGYGDYGGGRGYGQPIPQVGQQPQPGGLYEQQGVIVDVAPPAPYVEVVPVLPFLGALWIAGFWGWHGGRHHWVPGRYERPRPGYSWNAHGWVQQGGRWHSRGGGWVRR